jgi:O-succinylbenzoate synthase
MGVRIERVDLAFLEMPLKRAFHSALGTTATKTAWLVTVYSEGLRGYAESVAELAPEYSPETHASVYFAWKNHLLPRLWGNDIAHPAELGRLWSAVRGNAMAKAALEMAIWDVYARQQGEPLWKVLGGEPKSAVPAGVAIGLVGDESALMHQVADYWEQGYRRIKLKIQPGWDVQPVRRVRETFGALMPLAVDANASFSREQASRLEALDEYGLMMIEQPLSVSDWSALQRLAQRLATPVCLDESVGGFDDARTALELGAGRIINIKPGRVGGHWTAKQIHDLAQAWQVPVWCGGMLEYGVGRAHNVHLSTLPNFRLPGDLSASDRYFDHDIIDPPFRLNADGSLSVPAGPGIGVNLDPRTLKQAVHYCETFDAQSLAGGRPWGPPTTF